MECWVAPFISPEKRRKNKIRGSKVLRPWFVIFSLEICVNLMVFPFIWRRNSVFSSGVNRMLHTAWIERHGIFEKDFFFSVIQCLDLLSAQERYVRVLGCVVWCGVVWCGVVWSGVEWELRVWFNAVTFEIVYCASQYWNFSYQYWNYTVSDRVFYSCSVFLPWKTSSLFHFTTQYHISINDAIQCWTLLWRLLYFMPRILCFTQLGVFGFHKNTDTCIIWF